MKAALRKTRQIPSARTQSKAAAKLRTVDRWTDGALPGDRKWSCSGRSNGKKSFFTEVSCGQQKPSRKHSTFASPSCRDEHMVYRAALGRGGAPGVLSTFPRKKKSCCFLQGHLEGSPWLRGQRPPQASRLALLGPAHSSGAPTL